MHLGWLQSHGDTCSLDLDQVDLVHYRRLVTRWREWVNVVEDSRLLATAVIDRLAGGPR